MIGKTASCAAMALTFASYAIPGPGAPEWLQRVAAVAAVVALSALNYRGVTKTAVLARILVACKLIALTAFMVGIALAKPSQLSLGVWPTASLYGVLHRRPTRSERLLVVRGADLLRDRQRGRLHAARR